MIQHNKLLLLFLSLIFFLKIEAQVSFTLPSNPIAVNISYTEYFVDTDPGLGNATSISLTPGTDVTINNASVDLSAVSTGAHRLYLRTRDINGHWCLTNVVFFFKLFPDVIIPINPVAADIAAMEYFIDSDPGFGSGKPIPITPGADITLTDEGIDLTGLPNGVHRVYVRTRDAGGHWSLTNLEVFNIVLASVTIPPNQAPGDIARFEYFFDTDPGFGKGTTITITPTKDLSNYNFVADISALENDQQHTLYIRTFDGWSLTNTQTFVKGSVVPLTWISFNAKLVDRSVLLDWTTAQENNTNQFEIERSADGVHFEKIGSVPAASKSTESRHYSFIDLNPLNGITCYRIRQTDLDGKSSYSAVIRIRLNVSLFVQIKKNPVSQRLLLKIEGSGYEGIHLMIMNAGGRKYREITGHDGSMDINVQALPSGVYYLVYPSGGNTVSVPFTKM